MQNRISSNATKEDGYIQNDGKKKLENERFTLPKTNETHKKEKDTRNAQQHANVKEEKTLK